MTSNDSNDSTTGTDAPEWITAAEAQKVLRVTLRQTYRLAAEGKFDVLQTPQGKLYRRVDVMKLAEERGVANADMALSRGSDSSQTRAVASLLRQQAETLARIEQRPADPELVERLARIELHLDQLAERPEPSGPPQWFYALVAGAAVLATLAVLAALALLVLALL